MTTKLTATEQIKFNEMVELFGGKGFVDTAKIKRRILSMRKRKTNRTTVKDMEDMLGY